jgi:hypothetical protein
LPSEPLWRRGREGKGGREKGEGVGERERKKERRGERERESQKARAQRSIRYHLLTLLRNGKANLNNLVLVFVVEKVSKCLAPSDLNVAIEPVDLEQIQGVSRPHNINDN